MMMINPSTLSEAINRKKSAQVALTSSNACGFIIRSVLHASDDIYRAVNFIGVFEQGVSSLEIEEEIVFQSELSG